MCSGAFSRTQILYGAFANARIQKYLFKKFAECVVLAKQLLHSIEWNANAIFFGAFALALANQQALT